MNVTIDKYGRIVIPQSQGELVLNKDVLVYKGAPGDDIEQAVVNERNRRIEQYYPGT